MSDTTDTTITEKQLNAAVRALDRIDKAHRCAPTSWTKIVSTPGFAPTFTGMGHSRWCCDVCAPMVIEAITETCGSADVKQKASHA